MPYLVLQQAILDDGNGVAHPNAVWEPTEDVMAIVDSRGSITWMPWHDAATFLAAKVGTTKDGPLTQCQKTQQLDPADFAADAAYQAPGGSFSMEVSESLIYAAKLVKDTPALNPDGTQQNDPATGQPVLVSFFASAVPQTIGS